MSKPKIVVLCGSSRFVQEMAVSAWLIERDERAIAMSLHLLPHWYPDCPADHLAEHEGVAAAMDELHLRKIDLADEVFVVDRFGYIGSSTANEIRHAVNRGLPIRYYNSDPIGTQVKNMVLDSAAEQLTALKNLEPLKRATDTHRADKNEATAWPFWVIVRPIDPEEQPGHYELLEGVWFSRKAAEDLLERRRHAYGKEAFVYCDYGHQSGDWRDLCKLSLDLFGDYREEGGNDGK